MNTRTSRTRQHLINAGLKLFARYPVDAVSIDEIVETAEVAKGSFFNHFGDKQTFAAEIAALIRKEIEVEVTLANEGQENALERLANGMTVAVHYALGNPERTVVVSRQSSLATSRDHPLNSGLKRDIDNAIAQGYLRDEAATSGLLLWASAVGAIMLSVIDRKLSRKKASLRMQEIMFMVLIGMGVDEESSRRLSADNAERLRKMRHKRAIMT